jgi:hypothetical protein
MIPPKLRLFSCSAVGLSAASPYMTELKHVRKRTTNLPPFGPFEEISCQLAFGGMNLGGCSGVAAVFCIHATPRM